MPKITAATAPVIAIPTTAGTGSEVGRAALITLADGRKLGFISPHLIPKVAICDPELTLGLPPLAHRRHRHGRVHPLRRDLPLAALQPAGRGDRPGRPRPGRGLDRARRGRRRRPRRAPGHDDGGAAGRPHLPEGPGRGPLAVAPAGRAEGALAPPRHAQRRDPAGGAALQRAARRATSTVLRRTLDLPEGASLPGYFAALTARLGLPASLRQMGVPESCLPTSPTTPCSTTRPRPIRGRSASRSSWRCSRRRWRTERRIRRSAGRSPAQRDKRAAAATGVRIALRNVSVTVR